MYSIARYYFPKCFWIELGFDIEFVRFGSIHPAFVSASTKSWIGKRYVDESIQLVSPYRYLNLAYFLVSNTLKKIHVNLISSRRRKQKLQKQLLLMHLLYPSTGNASLTLKQFLITTLL